MSIHHLTVPTIRQIDSSQILTSPISVIKELVENSLDAGASNIEVQIHSNTLDQIEVRDNGHGIPCEDYPMVAGRHCTSKLIDYADLNSIGSKSLGFRGEALASIAELSGKLTIITKVQGQLTATELHIKQNGALERQAILPQEQLKAANSIPAHVRCLIL